MEEENKLNTIEEAPPEDNRFNVIEEMMEPPQDDKLTVCGDCGEPMDADWVSCPKCGKQTAPFDIWELISTISNAPTKEEIEALKTERGWDVRVAILDEDRVYFIRPLHRDLWKKFNTSVKNVVDEQEREEQLKTQIVNTCTVWPKPSSDKHKAFFLRAGTYNTLFEQIMHISDFHPPQIAVQMVYKV